MRGNSAIATAQISNWSNPPLPQYPNLNANRALVTSFSQSSSLLWPRFLNLLHLLVGRPSLKPLKSLWNLQMVSLRTRRAPPRENLIRQRVPLENRTFARRCCVAFAIKAHSASSTISRRHSLPRCSPTWMRVQLNFQQTKQLFPSTTCGNTECHPSGHHSPALSTSRSSKTILWLVTGGFRLTGLKLRRSKRRLLNLQRIHSYYRSTWGIYDRFTHSSQLIHTSHTHSHSHPQPIYNFKLSYNFAVWSENYPFATRAEVRFDSSPTDESDFLFPMRARLKKMYIAAKSDSSSKTLYQMTKPTQLSVRCLRARSRWALSFNCMRATHWIWWIFDSKHQLALTAQSQLGWIDALVYISYIKIIQYMYCSQFLI